MCDTVLLTAVTVLYISHSFAKQVTGVPIWSLSPPAWCWTGRWSWNVGAPALKSLPTTEPRKRGSSSGRFASPCDCSPPLLMFPIFLGPFLKWVPFPSLSVTPFCSWDFSPFSQPDFCPLKILGCLLFALSFHPTFCYFLLILQGWTKPNAFHVCITSYKLVLQDHQAFRRKNWRYLILDEAQNIKNFKSQRWQSLLNFNRWRWRCLRFVGGLTWPDWWDAWTVGT